MKEQQNRRKFIEQMAILGLSVPFFPSVMHAAGRGIDSNFNEGAEIDSISVFSKHLNFLNYEDMAVLVKDIGFDGIDLTVRPEGHVLPENVERDLPKAVEAAKKSGILIPTITTSITRISDPYTENILATASGLGIRHYRMGWLEYNTAKSLAENIEGFIPDFKALAAMNKKYGITGDYQNHAGIHVGAPVWDLYQILDHIDPQWIGCQYDIRHATFEGGNSWPLGLQVIYPFIHTIVIKDFYWKKTEGKWDAYDTPVGEGMVDFKNYFSMLKKLGTHATMSMHFEYPLTERADTMMPMKEKKEQVKFKMKKDLETVREFIQSAEIKYH